MDEITVLRNEIDEIDHQIMELLDKRFTLTNKIGDVKKHKNLSVFAENREKKIYDKTTAFSHKNKIKAIYKAIMTESKAAQRKR